MTILLGYCSPSQQAYFLGGDDTEHQSRRKVEKVVYLFGRYFVGGFGCDIAYQAARYSGYFEHKNTIAADGTRHNPPDSIEEFCGAIAVNLKTFAPLNVKGLEDAVADRHRTSDQARDLRDKNSNVVILDCREGLFGCATYLKPLSLPSEYKFELDMLAPGRRYVFGINGYQNVSAINELAIRDPMAWFSEELPKWAAISNGIVPGAVGNVGACYAMKDGSLTVRSPFDSIADAIRSNCS